MYAAPTEMEEKWPARRGIRLSDYDYSTAGYYFVTICTQNRLPIFADMQKTLTPIGKIAAQCLEKIPCHNAGVSIDLSCVMPDHIHVIIVIAPVGAAYMPPAARSKETLIKVIQQYKAAVTRLTGVTSLWQRGYYDHVIRNDADLAETRLYIQNNPLNWAKED